MTVNISKTRTAPNGLAYTSYGNTNSKTALLCIHGWGCRGSDFGPLFEQKAAQKAELFQSMFSEYTPPEFELAQLQHLKTLDKVVSSAIRDDYVRFDYEEYDVKLAALGRAGTLLLNVQSTDIGPDNHRVALKKGEVSKWMEIISEKAPQVQHVVVEESAHFPHVDQPERVAGLILDFVARVAGT